MKKALKQLLECDLNGYKVEIKPLNPNWYEYNNLVVDYPVEGNLIVLKKDV